MKKVYVAPATTPYELQVASILASSAEALDGSSVNKYEGDMDGSSSYSMRKNDMWRYMED